MSSWLYGYNTIVSDFPRFLGNISTCANSGYQAFSFLAHREPGYEATFILALYPGRFQEKRPGNLPRFKLYTTMTPKKLQLHPYKL